MQRRSGGHLLVPLPLAPLSRRVLSLIYEALLLGALLWCAGLIFVLVEARLSSGHLRLLFQLYLALIAGVYFVCQWSRTGQTLAMKTWRLRLVTRQGEPVRMQQACARYLIALAGLLLFAAGFLWACFDAERQFLHDRIAGTRILRS